MSFPNRADLAGMTCRPLRLEDVDAFHAVLDVVAREQLYLALTQAPPVETTREFVATSLAAGNIHQGLFCADRLVGWADICRLTRSSQSHRGVLGMGLLPTFRGHGLGRVLLASTLAGADAAGFTRVELTVRGDNARAIALYERLGFDHEGVQRRALLVDGVFHDLAMMARLR